MPAMQAQQQQMVVPAGSGGRYGFPHEVDGGQSSASEFIRNYQPHGVAQQVPQFNQTQPSSMS